MFNAPSLIGTRQELTGLLPGISRSAADGFDIQVGRSVGSQTMHIPQCVLSQCPTLNNVLRPGCRILNADPVVFAIIIQHLQTISIFGFISLSAPGRLPQLISSDDSLLRFAQAWHILDMLRKPDLQDKLIKVYRAYYLKCLEDQQGLKHSAPKPLGSGPFVYLRDNIGYHSKAEKFLIDFHAGLMQRQTELEEKDFKLLPPEIAVLIKNRWLELCGQVRKDSHHSDSDPDRIVASDACYKITKNEAILHSNLQIQYLCRSTMGTFGLNPPLPSTRAGLQAPRSSINRHQNRVDVLTERRQKSNRSGASKPKLENPFEASPPRRKQSHASSPTSPTHMPRYHDTPETARRSWLAARSTRRKFRDQAPRRSRVSVASESEPPSRAPLASDNPGRTSWSCDILDAEAADVGPFSVLGLTA